MTKPLKDILAGVKSSTVEPMDLKDWDKSPDGAKLTGKLHPIEKHADRTGNADGVFTAKNKVAPYKKQTAVSEEALDEVKTMSASGAHYPWMNKPKVTADAAKKSQDYYNWAKAERAKNDAAKVAKKKTTKEEVELDEGLKLVKTHTNGNRTAKVYKDNEWSEYRVKHFVDGKHQSKADYHTDDSEDAHDTANHFVSKAKINEGNEENKKKKKQVMADKPKDKKKSNFDPRETFSAMRRGRQVEEVEIEEASYSAKAAAAGKDIGKEGKNFDKIANKAAKEYGSEEAGKKVAGAILAKLRAKRMHEEDCGCNHSPKGVKCEVHGEDDCMGGKPYKDKKGRQLLNDKKKGVE